ncbi:hypothetical protein [Caedibacter taeniospiralis]|uniref:hypothetical protein n=1 Tax=Caedibacter taeniospiralis TaxID=28907 RepID=UPI000C27C81C|nr:hypothetical protein [Caedibacter taeniospiralis]
MLNAKVFRHYRTTCVSISQSDFATYDLMTDKEKEIERQANMTHKELFKLNGAKAAVRSLIFILIFAVFLYALTGDMLSPELAVIFFLIDASVNTFRHKWFKSLRK